MAGQSSPPEQERSSISLPVIVATAIFAIAAIAVIGFLLSSRNDEAEPELPVVEVLDLAAPLYRDGSTEFRLHLIVDDAEEGENSISVRFTQAGDQREAFDPGLEGVDLTLAPLTNADEGISQALIPENNGQYQTEDPLELHEGWWETTVTIYPSDSNAQSTIFYLLLPDPNMHTVEFGQFDGHSTAEGFFDAGMTQLASTHSIKYIERLTTGEGMVSILQREVTDGNGGEAAGHTINAQFELLTIGDQTYQRVPGGEWFEREFLPVTPVSEWTTLYEGATSFELGESVMVNGRPTQIITFLVPASDTLAEASYAWWVDEETGYVVREAMVSTWHYMIYEFGEFNQPLAFEVPISDATPLASPIASPSSS